jgi:hypothetical protein
MNLLWRLVLCGAIVSLFALIGDIVRPKRFAGLFGGAPSVALATLALTVAESGAATASIEARSMILGRVGFVAYACIAQRLLASGRWPASWVSMGGSAGSPARRLLAPPTPAAYPHSCFASVAGGHMATETFVPSAAQPATSMSTDTFASHQTLLSKSRCPRCMREQMQSFTRANLRQLLNAGHPIEAYCVMCDQLWALSIRERLQLAKVALPRG